MAKFDYFVVFAEMRTGSNHLEESLKTLPGVSMHGEVFNPVFVGGPNVEELFGHTLQSRESDPLPLLDRLVAEGEGLPGFRFFHDHDPRILERILPDPRCAKIILIRNPLESYISLKIAAATGQWRLTNAKMGKTAQVPFVGAEFDATLARLQDFQTVLTRGMQLTGQSAFYINYEDIGDLEVINGIAKFLGIEAQLEELPGKLKRQNPGALESKVTNPEEMHRHLERMDPFQLAKSPNFEPPRGAAVPSLVAAAESPLLHIPIKGGPDDQVSAWLAALDGKEPISGFSQKTLRPWMRNAKDYTAFAIVRHPLERAHAVFCNFILPKDAPGYADLRKVIRQQYGVPLPGETAGLSRDQHRELFEGFLKFLKSHLGGQSSVRIDPAFASQLSVIQGVSQVLPPHRIIREAEAADVLARLAEGYGQSAPSFPEKAQDMPFALADIHDKDLEDLAMEVYRKDYLTFGFKRFGR